MSHNPQEKLAALVHDMPVVKDCLERYGELSLNAYLRVIAEAASTASDASPLPTADVAQAAEDYLAPICGASTARQTARQLARQRLLLTANHQQAEFCAHVTQGNLLYMALLEQAGQLGDCIPIICCATVNLSNRHFPRGIMIYHALNGLLKVPVFFNKYKEDIMAAAIAFDEPMVRHGEKILTRQLQDGVIGEAVYHQARQLLLEDFLSPEVLALKRYAEQSILLNRRIFDRALKGMAPPFLYLELEEISIRLILNDLEKKSSFTSTLLLTDDLRRRLAVYLAGVRGCWRQETHQGTFLFWGVDAKRRRYSLFPSTDWTTLQGVDLDGISHVIPFNISSLRDNLQRRAIIPGLFLSFLHVYLLRGYRVCGGYFQGNYLQQMQLGLCRALRETRLFADWEPFIRTKKSFYLSGPILLTGRDGGVYPYGTLEMMENGGFTPAQIHELLDMTVTQSHINGLHGIETDTAVNN